MRYRLPIIVAIVSAVVVLGTTQAHAIPILQLYLEGATYDAVTDTWVLTPGGSSNGDSFRLWAIGNVAGPNGKGGPIVDVKLSAVYDTSVGDIEISLTSSTTGGLLGFTDPSTPQDASLIRTVSDGSTPKLGDGSDLPSHGEYGAGRTWQEFSLGNFDQTDSLLADFSGDYEIPFPTHSGGQINVYEISVTSAEGFGEHPFTIHFDLYNHVVGKNHNKYVFAPFSHDSQGEPGGTDGGANIVPEPSSFMLLISGLVIGLTLAWRKRSLIAA